MQVIRFLLILVAMFSVSCAAVQQRGECDCREEIDLCDYMGFIVHTAGWDSDPPKIMTARNSGCGSYYGGVQREMVYAYSSGDDLQPEVEREGVVPPYFFYKFPRYEEGLPLGVFFRAEFHGAPYRKGVGYYMFALLDEPDKKGDEGGIKARVAAKQMWKPCKHEAVDKLYFEVSLKRP